MDFLQLNFLARLRSLGFRRGKEKKMKAIFQSLRLPFASVTLSGIFLGTALAYANTGQIDFGDVLAVLTVAVAGHIACNLFNDYFDHLTGNDDLNENVTPLSGGSRVIQEDKLNELAVLLIAFQFLALSIVAGCWFVYEHPHINFLYFGATGLFLGFAYTAPPLKLVYRGFGEFIIVLTFGLFVVGGAYVAQIGDVTLQALFASLPVWLPAGLLTANILLVNTFPDAAADRAAGKRTFVVRFGPQNGIVLSMGFVLLSYVTLFVGVLLGVLPPLALMALGSLPIALAFFVKIEKIEENFMTVGTLAIALQVAFTVFASVGIIAQAFFA
jgi:1,4-dihydroxy-2-naphthoate octaprenyltransferase